MFGMTVWLTVQKGCRLGSMVSSHAMTRRTFRTQTQLPRFIQDWPGIRRIHLVSLCGYNKEYIGVV